MITTGELSEWLASEFSLIICVLVNKSVKNWMNHPYVSCCDQIFRGCASWSFILIKLFGRIVEWPKTRTIREKHLVHEPRDQIALQNNSVAQTLTISWLLFKIFLSFLLSDKSLLIDLFSFLLTE